MEGSTTIRRPTFSRSCSNTFVGEETWCFLRPATNRATCRCRKPPNNSTQNGLTDTEAGEAWRGARQPARRRQGRQRDSRLAGLYYTEYSAKAILWLSSAWHGSGGKLVIFSSSVFILYLHITFLFPIFQ